MEREKTTEAFLGLDIGGQSIRGIRLEREGRISVKARRDTPAARGKDAVLEAVGEVVGELLTAGPATSLAAGTPGGVDSSGIISSVAVNIPGWAGTHLAEELRTLAGVPAFVRNDGNQAAFGEWALRSVDGVKASRALLFVGLGTGIGGGYIDDGRILSGVDDRALEIGHVIVHPDGRPCTCGRSGCVEAYASGPSIARIALDLAPDYRSPLALMARQRNCLDAREVYEALDAGDELARAVHRIASEALARALGTAIALLAPDTIVLGGGVLTGAGRFVADMAFQAPRHVFAAASSGLRFEASLLGPEAGLVGAALYAAAQVKGLEYLKELAAALLAAQDGSGARF